MRKVFFIFLLSASLSATDHQECPKLYQSLWPDFCYTHLLEPDACSEITPLKDIVYHYCDDGDNAVFFPSLSLVTVDKFGNKVSTKSIEAHIPLDEFIYRSE